MIHVFFLSFYRRPFNIVSIVRPQLQLRLSMEDRHLRQLAPVVPVEISVLLNFDPVVRGHSSAHLPSGPVLDAKAAPAPVPVPVRRNSAPRTIARSLIVD